MFFDQEAFAQVVEYFDRPGQFVYFRSPEMDVLSVGEQASASYIAVVREIKDYYSVSARWGYVEVQESTNKLDRILSDLGEDVRAEILDASDSVIYQTARAEQEQANQEESLEITLNFAPYSLRFYKNTAAFDRSMRNFYVVLASVILITMGVAILFERILIKYLSKPLVNLDKSLKSITVQNLHVDITDEESTDIVRRLEDSFNAMLQKLQTSMQMEITAKTNEVKSQFFALQSQMNPHFLHNILAIISLEADLDGNTRIPEICRELGGILRYTSHMGDGFSTIEKEFEVANSYLRLMKLRYEELFEFEVKVEENARNVRVPKLIVQPICENCFKHGLKHVAPMWRIQVNAWVENKHWYIRIKDNGSGFTQEYLEEFNALKKTKRDRGKKYPGKHNDRWPNTP